MTAMPKASHLVQDPGMRSRFNSGELRRALGRFVTGVTIVTGNDHGAVHGMTANSFTSVSLDPPLLLICISHRAKMARVLEDAGWYGLSILSSEQEALSRHFSAQGGPALEVAFDSHEDVPLIQGALAHFVCRVITAIPVGDHRLFIGQVEHFRWEEGRPLLFYGGTYERLGRLEDIS